jgi:hypothetical protein
VDALSLATRLTLLLFVVWPGHSSVPGAAWAGPIVAGIMLLSGRHRPNPWWLLLAAVWSTICVLDGPASSPLMWLYACWSLGLGLASWDPDPPRAVAICARRLVGVVFLSALLWKAVLAPDYREGGFLHAMMSMPMRMIPVARLSGMDAERQKTNEGRLNELLASGQAGDAVAFESTERLAGVSRFMALASLPVELALALAFLIPGLAQRWRLVAFFVFAGSAWLVLPVPVFAMILTALVLAQATDASVRMRLALLAVPVLAEGNLLVQGLLG